MPAIVASRQSKLWPPSENLTNTALNTNTGQGEVGSQAVSFRAASEGAYIKKFRAYMIGPLSADL